MRVKNLVSATTQAYLDRHCESHNYAPVKAALLQLGTYPDILSAVEIELKRQQSEAYSFYAHERQDYYCTLQTEQDAIAKSNASAEQARLQKRLPSLVNELDSLSTQEVEAQLVRNKAADKHAHAANACRQQQAVVESIERDGRMVRDRLSMVHSHVRLMHHHISTAQHGNYPTNYPVLSPSNDDPGLSMAIQQRPVIPPVPNYHLFGRTQLQSELVRLEGQRCWFEQQAAIERQSLHYLKEEEFSCRIDWEGKTEAHKTLLTAMKLAQRNIDHIETRLPILQNNLSEIAARTTAEELANFSQQQLSENNQSALAMDLKAFRIAQDNQYRSDMHEAEQQGYSIMLRQVAERSFPEGMNVTPLLYAMEQYKLMDTSLTRINKNLEGYKEADKNAKVALKDLKALRKKNKTRIHNIDERLRALQTSLKEDKNKLLITDNSLSFWKGCTLVFAAPAASFAAASIAAGIGSIFFSLPVVVALYACLASVLMGGLCLLSAHTMWYYEGKAGRLADTIDQTEKTIQALTSELAKLHEENDNLTSEKIPGVKEEIRILREETIPNEKQSCVETKAKMQSILTQAKALEAGKTLPEASLVSVSLFKPDVSEASRAANGEVSMDVESDIRRSDGLATSL